MMLETPCYRCCQDANTGHDGSLSTGHANSCRDILSRLETMVIMGKELPISAIRSQIASGIDIIVQLGRIKDKSRKVLEISEVDGIENGEIKLRTLYRYQIDNNNNGRLCCINQIIHREKLVAAGLEV